MSAYYNENDKFAAAWLRELIKAKLIADGEVDERSIKEVEPADLVEFRQCHFFAGIGGWSYALRLAGWPDDREVWTGSCPCQPWSMAGFGHGTDDPRHLWPTWSELIGQCRPPVVFGEQTSSEDGRYWLDLVYVDMEARGYAIAACDLPACCIGAPHKRSRLWFVANADRKGCDRAGLLLSERESQQASADAAWCGETGAVDNADRNRAERDATGEGCKERATPSGRQDERRRRLQTRHAGDACTLGNANGSGLEVRPIDEIGRGAIRHKGAAIGAASATRGFWADCDWLYHDDGVYRAVEPGAFPLATRLPADVAEIRCYGNSIVPQVAQVIIEAYMQIGEERQ